MLRKGHLSFSLFFSSIFLVIGLIITQDWWLIPKTYFFAIFFANGPDQDQSFGLNHRHLLFHSLLVPLVFYLCFLLVPGSSFAFFVWGIHLACDTYQEPGRKPVAGFKLHFRGWTSTHTRLILWTNAVTCFVLSIIL